MKLTEFQKRLSEEIKWCLDLSTTKEQLEELLKKNMINKNLKIVPEVPFVTYSFAQRVKLKIARQGRMSWHIIKLSPIFAKKLQLLVLTKGKKF